MPWLIAAGVVFLWLLWTVAPWFRTGTSTDHREIRGDSVTSIQEIDVPDPPDDIAHRYIRRLRRLGGFLLWQTYWSENGPSVWCAFIPLIRFGAVRRESDRETLTVGTSLFSRRGGTVSFVRKGGKVRVELRGYRPRLTMFFYRSLQLPVHAALSRSFLAWLARKNAR